ncbi:hypothetical protein Aple_086250 [Acrocarpospora pleiomorpha]|uniref:HTH marR-type domain-containing protein n=1 Tax=Acrocarpospora pleiomorpha TaxID=90975 RepID=A0A5M3XXX1_9ACTN|nr:MarR family winged helix-turn-helix transcriptional regulator [Acrocarpospora pleiomorpha]GES25726.1 hypothetical protein Aple_086250 [Acrocarpospora pleiomorpha]
MSDETGTRPDLTPGDDVSGYVNDPDDFGLSAEEAEERRSLLESLGETQHGMGRFLARDRSLPLLASNLTMQQLKVVMTLAFLGSASGQDLARELGIGLGTVTGIVDRVVAQGLATRHEDPADRRVRRVELTPAGRDLTAQILDAGTATWRDLLAHLDLTTLRDLDRVMRRLLEVMSTLHPACPRD